jgi:hypothetical protein
MDAFTFIAAMTKALAWPVAALGIAALARKPVSLLIQGLRLQKLKGAGWEFEFTRQEEEVQRIVAQIPGEKLLTPAPAVVEPPSRAAGAGAILLAWTELEQLVRKVAGSSRPNAPFTSLLDELVEKGAVQPGTAEGLRGLQQLRNLAVHAPDDEALSAPRVAHFTTMANALRWTIENNLKKSGGPPQ